jgi:hypothetical protein
MSAYGKRVVLMSDPYNEPEDGPYMQFRLTYEGLLLSTQKDPVSTQRDAKADHKHTIRQAFHTQLKRLWDITLFLKTGNRSGPSSLLLSGGQAGAVAPVYDRDSLAAKHSHFGWNFVPLVTQDLELICGLDILFLRPHPPGTVLQSGDIDNRLKTLFDSLRIPTANEEYSQRGPEPSERPFYCLLEDDRLITKVSVETDQLLQYISINSDVNDVRLVITVTLRPYEMHLGNIQFG